MAGGQFRPGKGSAWRAAPFDAPGASLSRLFLVGVLLLALLNQGGMFAAGTAPGPSAPVLAAQASAPPLEQVSVAGRGGDAGNADSSDSSISSNGRWVAFTSEASNLDPAVPDTIGSADVFLFDRQDGVTVRVSPNPVAPCASECPNGSRAPTISADGSVVAFVSDRRLVPEDGNDESDVYVRRMPSGVTRLVSFDQVPHIAVGGHSPSISGDGRFVAFASGYSFGYSDDGSVTTVGTFGTLDDVFLRDIQNLDAISVPPPRLVSTRFEEPSPYTFRPVPGNGVSGEPSVSFDGAYVAFTSLAADLVPVDDNGRGPSVFRRAINFAQDPFTVPGGTTVLVSPGNDGRGGDRPSISADGNVVAFVSSEPAASATGNGNFGPVSVSFGAVTVFTLANTGGGVLNVNRVSISGSTDFVVDLPPDPFAFAPTRSCLDAVSLLEGETCTVGVRFVPGSVGAKTATLVFDHNPAPVLTQTTVALQGVGTAPPPPPRPPPPPPPPPAPPPPPPRSQPPRRPPPRRQPPRRRLPRPRPPRRPRSLRRPCHLQPSLRPARPRPCPRPCLRPPRRRPPRRPCLRPLRPRPCLRPPSLRPPSRRQSRRPPLHPCSCRPPAWPPSPRESGRLPSAPAPPSTRRH
jgi:hypothetical protein